MQVADASQRCVKRLVSDVSSAWKFEARSVNDLGELRDVRIRIVGGDQVNLRGMPLCRGRSSSLVLDRFVRPWPLPART